MILTEEIIKESYFYQETLEKGRLEGAQRCVRRILRSRFPFLEELPQLDLIASEEVLEALLEQVVAASSAEEVRSAVLRAASSSDQVP